MTRRTLWWAGGLVVVAYAVAVALGVYLRARDLSAGNVAYATFKDLISLVVAIPAALLALAFQRRASYMQSLRSLWRTVLDAVHSAEGYTYLDAPSPEAYSNVLAQLSVAVDEVRGVFKNVPARGAPRGWYPFEPLKQIRAVMRELGHGPRATPERRDAARRQIESMWLPVRDQMLLEFDREVPSYHHAGYAPRQDLPSPASGVQPPNDALKLPSMRGQGSAAV